MSISAFSRFRAARHPVIGMMLFALFLLQTLAASDALHLGFHSEAGSAGHACAVTLFSSGQVDLQEPSPCLPPLPEFSFLATSAFQTFAPGPLLYLLPSRGPPSLA